MKPISTSCTVENKKSRSPNRSGLHIWGAAGPRVEGSEETLAKPALALTAAALGGGGTCHLCSPSLVKGGDLTRPAVNGWPLQRRAPVSHSLNSAIFTVPEARCGPLRCSDDIQTSRLIGYANT